MGEWIGDDEPVSGGWSLGQCRAMEVAMAVFVALLIAVEAIVGA
jgi:hypothetical protein